MLGLVVKGFLIGQEQMPLEVLVVFMEAVEVVGIDILQIRLEVMAGQGLLLLLRITSKTLLYESVNTQRNKQGA
jgi:hypothetical protein